MPADPLDALGPTALQGARPVKITLTREEAEASFLAGKQPSGRFVEAGSVAAVLLLLALAPEVDCVVIGEAENVIGELVAALPAPVLLTGGAPQYLRGAGNGKTKDQ